MQRIFISDLHLEDPAAPAFLRFQECLALEATRNDEIYILGDLVEMWIGDDDDSQLASELYAVLAATTAQCPVLLLHGNRDFLFADEFANATGVTLLGDPHLTADGILLSHGDQYCTDDQEYQAMRTLFRSEAWQQDILGKSLDERKALGQMLRAQSRNSNANKATNIMDVNADAVHTSCREHETRLLIHGHTHRPGTHRADNHERWVLGAWERVGWLARQQEQQLQLEAFSLARRYGT